MVDKISVRAMRPSDIPAVGRLFLRIFRGVDCSATPELQEYLRLLAFGSPSYREDVGSYVVAQEDGQVKSAIIAVPMRFATADRTINSRLLCAYMSDPHDAKAAAALALSHRAKYQDLAFTDSASPKSWAHIRATGGIALPIQGLEWRRTLRPLSALIGRIELRRLRWLTVWLSSLARPFDDVVRALVPRLRPQAFLGNKVIEMQLTTFLDCAPGLVAHYSVRPVWTKEELEWLVKLASENRRFGHLGIRAVYDKNRLLLGCFIYWGKAGQSAKILNYLALKDKENEVFAAMINDLDQLGFADVVGQAQPKFMHCLAGQTMLAIRHKAFVCLMSKHPDIVRAAQCGDIYLGGLAGESWSRLMSDFY